MTRFSMLMVLAAAVTSSLVVAQPPANLEITPQAGQWFICVTSFSGPDPRRTKDFTPGSDPTKESSNPKELAIELANELRTKHRLNAYIFDRGEEERAQQAEMIRRRQAMVPGSRVKTYKIPDQYAVLVGGYRDMDAARDALDDIKRIMPSDKFCMIGERVVPGKSDTGEEGVFHQVVRYSPFTNAFVAHNPTIETKKPNEHAKDLDTVLKEVNLPLLKKLNSGEPRSLLRNPKPWTLVVATFQSPYKNVSGPTGNILTKSINKIMGKEDERNASAENAQKFAEVMSNPQMLSKHAKTGLDTYVLHTSYYSLVTVGGYDSENDPRMRQVQEMLMRMQQSSAPGGPKLLPVMHARPMPMPVPR